MKPNKSAVCEYSVVLSESRIECTIQTPTSVEFVKANLVFSCIGHINIRVWNGFLESAVVSQKLADHYFAGCQLVVNKHKKDDPGKGKVVHIADMPKFKNFLRSYYWSSFSEYVDLIDAYPKLVGCLCDSKVAAKRKATSKGVGFTRAGCQEIF